MPHPWSCGRLSGPGEPELSRLHPGSRCRRSRAAPAGGFRNCNGDPEPRGERSRVAAGRVGGFFLRPPFFWFFFFFPPSQRLERIPQSRNPECWSGISANPECCKAVPADARGFAGVSGSELGQVLKRTCSEELGKLQQDMSCFGHGGPWAHHP